MDNTDWFEYKGKQCVIYIDDASRFIPSHGEFDNANTDNSLKVFRKGLKYGIPKQVMSDHGTSFSAEPIVLPVIYGADGRQDVFEITDSDTHYNKKYIAPNKWYNS